MTLQDCAAPTQKRLEFDRPVKFERGIFMPPTSEEKLLAELSEKLDVLIKVVCIQVGENKSTTERARLLKLAGVDNQTIALVLNTSSQVVRTLTSNLRRKESTR